MTKKIAIYNVTDNGRSFQIGATIYAQGQILSTFKDECANTDFYELWMKFMDFCKNEDVVNGVALNHRIKNLVRKLLRGHRLSKEHKIFLHDTAFLNENDVVFTSDNSLTEVINVINSYEKGYNFSRKLSSCIRREKRHQYNLNTKLQEK